jgi:hypothetical protein
MLKSVEHDSGMLVIEVVSDSKMVLYEVNSREKKYYAETLVEPVFQQIMKNKR